MIAAEIDESPWQMLRISWIGKCEYGSRDSWASMTDAVNLRDRVVQG
jgi:hypothetical protein